ncbi:MAG: hypothetical protein PVG39_02460 [Desulfobacteraceae bacterium]|jgi:hypothetical protein
MKKAKNKKIIFGILPQYKNHISVYQACPYCGFDDWASVSKDKKSAFIECDKCFNDYILDIGEVKK